MSALPYDWSVRVAGLIVAAAGLMAQDNPVIRVPVRLVAVPTLVYSKDNRLMPGLKKSDFRVFDNGVPQKIDLDTDDAPVSVVIAIQGSGPSYVTKVGSVMEAHLVGGTGRAAVLAYDKDVRVLKPFGSGDVRAAFRSLAARGGAKGKESRMVDAGMEAVRMLSQRPRTAARVLLFIGQAADRGSKAGWAELEAEADRENVSIYALVSAEAKPELSSAIVATGGSEMHFHRQSELEDVIGRLGVELRSAYLLSYYPSSSEAGRHSISVEVSVAGAKTQARPGYVMSPN